MTSGSTRDLVHRYYEAWAAQDRQAVRSLLDNHLVFVSPQDRFESADAFLSACWRYSDGLRGVEFVKEVYDEHQASVILRWSMEDGSFAGAEYVRVLGDRIVEILVVNNDPAFGDLLK
jgi:hypothetical protein